MKGVCAAAFLFLAVSTGAGCQSKTAEREAIRASVLRYLSSRPGLDLDAMDVDVLQTTVNGDYAAAQVRFRAKSAAAEGAGMEFAYSLEKRGAEWVVVKSAPGDGAANHPAAGGSGPRGMPPGHPAVDDFAKGSAGHSRFRDLLHAAPPEAQNPPAAPQVPASKP